MSTTVQVQIFRDGSIRDLQSLINHWLRSQDYSEIVNITQSEGMVIYDDEVFEGITIAVWYKTFKA